MEYYSAPQQVLELWLELKTLEEKNDYFSGSYKYSKKVIVARLCESALYQELVQSAKNVYQKWIDEGFSYQEELSICEQIIDHYQQDENLTHMGTGRTEIKKSLTIMTHRLQKEMISMPLPCTFLNCSGPKKTRTLSRCTFISYRS